MNRWRSVNTISWTFRLSYNCEVQLGQRFAGMGIAVEQKGQSLVVGAAATGARCNLFAVRTTRKMTNATIRKLMIVFRNCPYAITGAVVLAAARGGSRRSGRSG